MGRVPGTRQHSAAQGVQPGKAAVGGLGPEPARLASGDIVPRFRTDLRVERRSPGLFDLVDPRFQEKRFTLYDFELAIARMLDGRRRAREVVEHGVRLGIPIDIDGLNKFVRQMWHYGFLAAGTQGDDGGAAEKTWGERERWDEATRTLFQTGLRLMRTGRPADAASYFEAVLDAHPAHPEAAEMLAAIAKGRSVDATPIGEVVTARDAPVPAPRPQLPLARVAASAGSWVRARRWLGFIAAALALAGVAAAAALLWWESSTGPSAQHAPPAPVPVAVSTPAAGSGRPASSSAKNPSPQPQPVQERVRSAPLTARQHPAIVRIVSPASGALRWRVAAGRQVKEGEAVAEVRRQERSIVILALTAGVLARSGEDRGRAAKEEVLGRILDANVWEVEASLEGDGDAPGTDWECEIRGDAPGERAPCQVLRAAKREGEPRRVSLTAEVSASSAPWIERASSPRICVAPAGTALTAP